MIRIALYQPDIAQNTGTILRLGACFGVPVDVIGPTGFDMSDKALKRAALDYLAHVELVRHVSFESFLASRGTNGHPAGRLILLTSKAASPCHDFTFLPGDTLLFGRESAGCPQSVHEIADARITIPIRPGLRSLNVAVSVAIATAEALRQLHAFPTN